MYKCLKCRKTFKGNEKFDSNHVANMLCPDCEEGWYKFIGSFLQITKKDISELFDDYLHDRTPCPFWDRIS